MSKKIEIDVFNMKVTVSEAVEKGNEFIEAVETAQMINSLIFEQIDNKTSKQTGYIIGDVRRFLNSIEYVLLEQRKKDLRE